MLLPCVFLNIVNRIHVCIYLCHCFSIVGSHSCLLDSVTYDLHMIGHQQPYLESTQWRGLLILCHVAYNINHRFVWSRLNYFYDSSTIFLEILLRVAWNIKPREELHLFKPLGMCQLASYLGSDNYLRVKLLHLWYVLQTTTSAATTTWWRKLWVPASVSTRSPAIQAFPCMTSTGKVVLVSINSLNWAVLISIKVFWGHPHDLDLNYYCFFM